MKSFFASAFRDPTDHPEICAQVNFQGNVESDLGFNVHVYSNWRYFQKKVRIKDIVGKDVHLNKNWNVHAIAEPMTCFIKEGNKIKVLPFLGFAMFHKDRMSDYVLTHEALHMAMATVRWLSNHRKVLWLKRNDATLSEELLAYVHGAYFKELKGIRQKVRNA